MLGVGELDQQQHDVLYEIPKPKKGGPRNVAIKSGHACGKTFIAAIVALWWYFTRFPSIVITTAPTLRQVREILWKEIHKRFKILQKLWPTQCSALATQLKHPNDEAQFLGFTSRDEAVRFQGFHAGSGSVLVVADEASGLNQEIWDAIHGITTGPEDWVLAISNAIYDPGAEFVQAFTTKANTWRRFTLNSEKSTWCSRKWIEGRAAEWGRESILFLSKVLGQFPKNATDCLIPPAWIEMAHLRWDEQRWAVSEPVTDGIDVARFGSDMTAHARMRGIYGRILKVIQGQDLMETAGMVARAIKDGEVMGQNVRIDDTGLGGGVTDRLHEQEYPVVPFNFGARAVDSDKFHDSRTELYWFTRELLREGKMAVDPEDTDLMRELVAPKYKMDSMGRIQMEQKADTKKRLKYSPDRADALTLAAAGQSILAEPASHSERSASLTPGHRIRQSRPSFRTAGRLSEPGFGRGLRGVGRPR